MFLRCKVRRKDGKQHRYWSVVENTRIAGGRVVQRHVLYLGEINDTQEAAWRRSIEVFEDGVRNRGRCRCFRKTVVQESWRTPRSSTSSCRSCSCSCAGRGSALADLLGEDAGLAEIHQLYRCHDRLLVHKQAVFDHLAGRWRDLFNRSYDVLLYDLTSPYFEADPPFPEGGKRRFGYSREVTTPCSSLPLGCSR